jgi:hypothetical protein
MSTFFRKKIKKYILSSPLSYFSRPVVKARTSERVDKVEVGWCWKINMGIGGQ